ncbi:MAG: hypothetical protein FJ095_20570 [Deltaproteobacteria bacterium]|nr:hypothetical protein [Deltaproteobacteria bacterium]
MKTILSKPALVALSFVAVTAACNKDESGADSKGAASSASATASAATPPPPPPAATSVAAVVPDVPTTPGSTIAKTELDGKAPDEGWSGGTLAVSKLTFTTAKGWASKSGDFSVSAASDGSTGIAAGKYPDGAQPSSLRDAAAKALGVTDCSWATTETISLGKDKLAAQAADGSCKRDGKPAKAVFVATSGKDMNVLAVASWDDGKDSKAALNTLRSAKGAGGGGDSSGIAACCAAIKQNMASAPIMYQGAYAAAYGACNSAMSSPDGKKALGTVRSMLSMAGGAPASCQ